MVALFTLCVFVCVCARAPPLSLIAEDRKEADLLRMRKWRAEEQMRAGTHPSEISMFASSESRSFLISWCLVGQHVVHHDEEDLSSLSQEERTRIVWHKYNDGTLKSE